MHRTVFLFLAQSRLNFDAFIVNLMKCASIKACLLLPIFLPFLTKVCSQTYSFLQRHVISAPFTKYLSFYSLTVGSSIVTHHCMVCSIYCFQITLHLKYNVKLKSYLAKYKLTVLFIRQAKDSIYNCLQIPTFRYCYLDCCLVIME